MQAVDSQLPVFRLCPREPARLTRDRRQAPTCYRSPTAATPPLRLQQSALLQTLHEPQLRIHLVAAGIICHPSSRRLHPGHLRALLRRVCSWPFAAAGAGFRGLVGHRGSRGVSSSVLAHMSPVRNVGNRPCARCPFGHGVGDNFHLEMAMTVIFHWDRMGIRVRRGDRVRVRDTGAGHVVSVNGRRVLVGSMQDWMRRHWVTSEG